MDRHELREQLEHRGPISWVGEIDGQLRVRLGTENHTSVVELDDSQYLAEELEIIYNLESDIDPANSAIVNPRQYSLTRLGAVLGVNVCGTCEPGGFTKYSPMEGACTMSYDIEVDISSNEPGEFPLSDNRILSIACSCSCGLQMVFVTLDTHGKTSSGSTRVVQCDSSCSAVQYFIAAVTVHMPLWLIGWNNYGFDNQCMLYHNPAMASICEQVRVGGSKMVAYGCIIHIPGCYNIDAMAYMSRARPGEYSAMSLKVVASETGCSPKLDMPEMSLDVDLDNLVEYNVNDCNVALEVWTKSGLCTEIPSLAACASAPVYDCGRYITGTMVPLLVSSIALSKGMMLNWSVSSRDQEYKGGFVVDPTRGHHRSVMVCDFSSMYPTIMSCCNISPQTVQLDDLRPGELEDDVTWDSSFIRVALEDRAVKFPYRSSSLIKETLLDMVALRTQHKRADPLYAKSLKVCANSAYGCIGYSDSAMYSPSCSAAVTSIGRWCVKLAYRVFERRGLAVLYGDTDSCFVTPVDPGLRTDTGCHMVVQEALAGLKAEFASTPLSSMSMEMESYHPGVILLDKKRYCKQSVDGGIKYTGVSAARRNVAGLVKETCMRVAESILNHTTRREQLDAISRHLETVMKQVLEGRVSVKDVSSIASRDGVKCYAYKSSSGVVVRRQLGESHHDASDVCTKEILNSVKEECNRLTIPCYLGDTLSICMESDRFLD